MKNRILEVSISGLQKDGLRFSVDTIAKELKISKKTVYKYFPSKEELAVAVYEKFYCDLDMELSGIDSIENDKEFIQVLDLYYRSYCMIREDIFNKFALNDSIKNYALVKHGIIVEKFRNYMRGDKDTVVFIIDSVFEKLNGAPLNLEIAKKLEQLI